MDRRMTFYRIAREDSNQREALGCEMNRANERLNLYSKYHVLCLVYMDYVHDYHCVHGLYYHLVLVVAYRRKFFSDSIRARAVEIITDLAPRFAVRVLEVDGEEDHLHFLLQVSPHTPFSRFVNSIKTVTSRRLKSEFPEIRQLLFKDKFWSGSYFVASTGGAPLEAVKRYIREQRL